MASWSKRLGVRLPSLGSRVCGSVTPCGFHVGRNWDWVGFSRGFSRFPLPQISFHNFSTLISSISFHLIFFWIVVGRHWSNLQNQSFQTLQYRYTFIASSCLSVLISRASRFPLKSRILKKLASVLRIPSPYILSHFLEGRTWRNRAPETINPSLGISEFNLNSECFACWTWTGIGFSLCLAVLHLSST